MSTFNGFNQLFQRNFTDEQVGIPISFKKLERYVHGIQRSRYWLFGGLTGSGKTACVDELFVIGLFDWWYENYKCDESEYKISWIYNSMERNSDYKIAKWTALKLFKDTGDLISADTMIGATKKSEDPLLIKENQLLHFHKERIEGYEKYFDELDKHIIIYSGSASPDAIRKRYKKAAKKFGKYVEEKDEYGDVVKVKYEYHHPNHIVIGINDHIGKIEGDEDKRTIDAHSKNMGNLRDLELFVLVDISQFNRAVASDLRKKNDDMYPRLEDFKNTANTQENSDYVLALFDPYRYNVKEFNGYDVESFISATGENRYRNLSLLKNSYGASDIDFGLGFLGEVGKFYELPTSGEIVKPRERSKVDKLLKLK